jgi:hypothetical protein
MRPSIHSGTPRGLLARINLMKSHSQGGRRPEIPCQQTARPPDASKVAPVLKKQDLRAEDQDNIRHLLSPLHDSRARQLKKIRRRTRRTSRASFVVPLDRKITHRHELNHETTKMRKRTFLSLIAVASLSFTGPAIAQTETTPEAAMPLPPPSKSGYAPVNGDDVY